MQGPRSINKLPIKAMVVDDSAFMRRVIISMLENDADIEVVGYARNGEDALNKISRLNPDIITMDVEMPKMDGLETLEKIMDTKPLPVIMLSAYTKAGAYQTIKALEIGAVDFVTKPEGNENMQVLAEELPEKIKIAAGAKIKKTVSTAQKVKTPEKKININTSLDVVAIGTSTGGPTALQKVLTKLPKDLPVGVIVVQHMPKGFTKPLADRLNELCFVQVKEAETGDVIEPGKVLIAKAGFQINFKRNASKVEIELVDKALIKTLFKPSVDVMLLSLSKVYRGNCLGVILTGMGSDGTIGLKKIKELGAPVLAQDEESCVVYGMPKSAVEAGLADDILPLEKIGDKIVQLVKVSI